jgi:chitodextrinase
MRSWLRWWTGVLGVLALLVPPAAGSVFESQADPSWQLGAAGVARSIASTPGAVYVGGDFASVTDGAVGGAVASRPHLAAFDPATGDWLPTFAPSVNGVVHALATSDDGSRLFVGGAFTEADGMPVSGLVELDPLTGAAVSALAPGTTGVVYDLEVVGDELYVVGNLTWLGPVQVTGAGRIDLQTGVVDPSWRPQLSNGSARAVAVQPSSGRVYLGGFFSGVNADPERSSLVAVSRASGDTDSDFQPGAVEEVFDLAVTDDKLYIAHGGPGGRGDVRDPVNGSLLASHLGDGDVQAVAVSGTRVYFGHHGEIVDGSYRPWVYALDRASDEVVPDFHPDIDAALGVGVWSVHDAGTHLWVGGAIQAAAPTNGAGFLRFPASTPQPSDTTAPTVPGAPQVTATGDDFVELSWGTSLDDSGELYYRVRRDGTLVGTADHSPFIDTTITPATTATYEVEAVDAAQNVSVSPPIVATTLPPLVELVPFDFGGTWRFLDNGVPAAGWDLPGFDDALWEAGPGQLGRGDGDEATIVDLPIAPSVTVYLRTEVEVPLGWSVVTALFDHLRDDGVLVRVNGVEVLRDNLPAGSVDATTRALVWETANESTVFTSTLEPSLFVEGTNVLSVELHNASSGGDLSFDAALRLGLSDDTTAPSVPGTPSVDSVDAGAVSLSWTASTDDHGVVGYEVLRDGLVSTYSAGTTVVDTGLDAGTGYEYRVRAVDAAGNRSAVSEAVLAVTADQALDVSPPSAPGTPVAAIVTESSVALTWSASTDDIGVVGYEVWRDGVKVADATEPGYVGDGLAAATLHHFVVVALDAAGNRSASSGELAVTTAAAPSTVVEAIPFGADWAYRDDGVYPGADWVLAGYDDAAWARGPAQLGAGDGDETTIVVNRPTVWFRTGFDVPDPTEVERVDVDLVADDGAVVFVNGVEVLRDNVGVGPVDGTTPATSYRFGASESLARSFSVPPTVLTAGVNTVAVAVVNGPGSADLSFDLRAQLTIGLAGAPDTAPPTAPAGLIATNVGTTSAQLSWLAAVDDVAVAGYALRRDGVDLVTTTGLTLSDTGLAPDTSYLYEVSALDAAGNQSPWAALVVSTEPLPPVEEVWIPAGSTWRYLDTGEYPGDGWIGSSFDDVSWPSGVAPFAAADPGATVVLNQPTLWLRRTFLVADPASVVGVELDVRADDGVVVFVSGVEVLRDNVPAGPVDGSTPASTYRWGAAETAVSTFAVPPEVLTPGVNVIAVAVVNRSGSGDSSADLGLRAFLQP